MALHRTMLDTLVAWKNSRNRKPLLLRGARQTGKTWLATELGRREYRNTVRVDFMKNRHARRFFDDDFGTARILTALEIESGTSITPGDTLIVFDEIQECPHALTSLKYFCEDANQYHVIATGSYMGISRHENVSYPVGKIDSMTLHPLSFLEFLDNNGQSRLADIIQQGRLADISPAFYDRLTEQLKTYMFVGGMPAVVADYVEHHDLGEVRRLQSEILDDFDGDFSKHASPRILERLRLTWNSLPAQLAKENRKFVYGVVRPGARAREFEESLQWLCDYGVASRIPCVSAIRMPLKSYASISAFKMFALDTGLLGALSGLDARTLLDGSAMFTEFRGALTEQYVCQQLIAQDLVPYYWAKPNSQSEVDFVTAVKGDAIPIEVKAKTNLRAKSLKNAATAFGIPRSVRTSLAGWRDDGWVVNIPLWAIGALAAALSA